MLQKSTASIVNVKKVLFITALKAEELLRNDIDSIWDDRVLNRSYEVFGGIPQVKLVDGEDSVSEDIKKNLMDMVSVPDQTK